MTNLPLPDAETIGIVLASYPGAWGRGARVLSVRDLSAGLSRAAVLRVSVAAPDHRTSQWIVKIPGWGQPSLLDSQDERLDSREVDFFDSTLPDLLPGGLVTPSDPKVIRWDGLDWIVMRDAAAVLHQTWTPDAAQVAARRIAPLFAMGAAHPEAVAAPWLEHAGYAAYAHYIPAAHDNLETLSDEPLLRALFTPDQVRALHACLDASEDLSARAARLPTTLVHGDLTPRNAGLDPYGALVLIGWAHVGVGPVGFDLGTFVSLYRAFGGHGELDEPALLDTYGHAVSDLAGTDLRAPAALGFAITQLTWGLHLRLGPGLTAVRQGFHGDDRGELAAHLADLRSSSLRALSWASAAGITAADPAAHLG